MFEIPENRIRKEKIDSNEYESGVQGNSLTKILRSIFFYRFI